MNSYDIYYYDETADGNYIRFYHHAIRCSVQKILMKQQVFVIREHTKEHICQFSLLPVRMCRDPFGYSIA